MIGTFDLILLGGLISLGGISFLFRAYRRSPVGPPLETSAAGNSAVERRQRAEAMAGVRWLTVGGLALVIGYTRGADSVYLFDPWTDVAFHALLLSGCWAATAFRITRARGTQRRECRVTEAPSFSSNRGVLDQ